MSNIKCEKDLLSIKEKREVLNKFKIKYRLFLLIINLLLLSKNFKSLLNFTRSYNYLLKKSISKIIFFLFSNF